MAEHLTDAILSPDVGLSPQQKIADLLTVLDVTRRLASTAMLQPLLEQIEQSALRVLDCERASLFVHDASSDELVTRVSTGAPAFRIPARGLGFAATVFQTGEIINVPDAYADARFNPSVDRKTGFCTRSILTCPLRGWDNEMVGVIQVLNKRGGPFGPWDEVLVNAFGAQAGVALQRQLLLEEYEKKRQFERDLDLARRIQQSLLPEHPPEIPGFEVAGWNCPADQTGGDFYDFQRLPSRDWAITVADASGHGIGAALVTAQCRSLLRATLVQTEDLERIVPQVNELLCADLPDGRFVTCFFGLLMEEPSRFRYLSAGHGPVLFYQRAQDAFLELPTQGCPLGLLPEYLYDPAEDIHFAEGDILAIFTDGFFEWSDPGGKAFGVPGLERCLRASLHLPAGEIIRAIHQAVLDHADGTGQMDDLTAVVIKRREG
jgi:sigma-B regulation protein RsbU (phosphoserine phosphatase)